MTAALGAILFGIGPLLRRPTSAIVPALAFALAGNVAVWAIGGLEQALVAALLAWGVALALPLAEGPIPPRRLLGAAACLALLCLTRPDGPLFIACLAIAVVLARRFERAAFADALRLAALPALAVVLQLAFRLIYYGDWVANTARVKVAFSWPRLLGGLAYVGDGLLWLGGLTFLALLGLGPALAGSGRRRLLLLVLPLLAWLAYVAAVGGDIFPRAGIWCRRSCSSPSSPRRDSTGWWPRAEGASGPAPSPAPPRWRWSASSSGAIRRTTARRASAGNGTARCWPAARPGLRGGRRWWRSIPPAASRIFPGCPRSTCSA